MAIRIPINLASEPFRRDRPVLIGSLAAGVVLTVLLLFQIAAILSARHQAADTRAALARLDSQLRSTAGGQARLDATMRRPENSEVLERSLFLNTLIERKAISWTRIFADLEKVMPPSVRLVSVRLPQVDSRNNVLLDMVVGAREVAPVLEFLRKLENSPQFGPSSVLNSLPPSQTDQFYRYHVSVSYAQKL
jgi:Tfp pilus assembly protein PilN